MTNKTTTAAIASLKLPNTVPALIQYAQGIVTGMTDNPAFPNPSPPLAQVTAAITALNDAENPAATRVKGAASARNIAHAGLVTKLKQLKSYVQTTADTDAENSAALIESARGGAPRLVRVGVQPGRRPHVDRRAAQPAGEDHGQRAACGDGRAVPLPRRHEGGGRRLERRGHASREVARVAGAGAASPAVEGWRVGGATALRGEDEGAARSP